MSNIYSYLQTLEEQSAAKGIRKPGNIEGAKNATIEPLKSSDVEGVEDLEEPEHLQGVTTNEERVKYNHMKNTNVFESLYKKAIQEDFDTAGGGFGDEDLEGGDMGASADGDEFGEEEAGDYDAEGHVSKVQEVVSLLQQALEILQDFEGEEEEEYEEYENEEGGEDEFGGGDEFGDEETVSEEETQFGQAKTIGHALVNRNAFDKGQTKKSNMLVKGANPKTSNKKASPQYGKNINGKPSNFSDAGSKKMQSKGNMKVAGRASNTGKFAFED